MIFLGASDRKHLARVATLRSQLQPAGALWIIRPKGKPSPSAPNAPSEAEVRAAGKAAGLVDIKVVAFSATHTAEKFVIPVVDRQG